MFPIKLVEKIKTQFIFHKLFRNIEKYDGTGKATDDNNMAHAHWMLDN